MNVEAVTTGELWPPLPSDAKDSTQQFIDHPTRHNVQDGYINYIASKIASALPRGGTARQALSVYNVDGVLYWRTLRPVKHGGTPGMTLTRIGANGYDWREPESAKSELDKQGVTQWWHIDTVPPVAEGEGRTGDVWVVIKEVAANGVED